MICIMDRVYKEMSTTLWIGMSPGLLSKSSIKLTRSHLGCSIKASSKKDFGQAKAFYFSKTEISMLVLSLMGKLKVKEPLAARIKKWKEPGKWEKEYDYIGKAI